MLKSYRMRTSPEVATAAEADEIIRNTYRSLLTRGMKGCYVYCTDAALARHLRESMTTWQYAAVSL